MTAPDVDGAASLAAGIDAELAQPVPPEVTLLARGLAARARGGAVAVLFYGSALRDGTLDGLLDFYILVDGTTAWPGVLQALANRVLPPNVGYVEEAIEGRVLRAKYAVMTIGQFRRGMSPRSLDTTLWTRFSQPCACVHARSEADRAGIREAIGRAAITAAYWAAMLGPERGDAPAYWRALYVRTYELELRVESAAHSEAIVARSEARYARLLPQAWRAAGIAFEAGPDGRFRAVLGRAEQGAALRRWTLRRRLGRPLNLLRLIKAALTFEHAMDYVVWKIERHAGTRLELAPWQRRFPLIAAPGLYCRLRRLGILR